MPSPPPPADGGGSQKLAASPPRASMRTKAAATAKRCAAAGATRAEPDPIAGASVSLLVAGLTSGGGITGMDEMEGREQGEWDFRLELSMQGKQKQMRKRR